MKVEKSQINRLNTSIIFDYMKKHRLNKSKFSKLCGFSQSTLNRVLVGNPNIRFETLLRLVNALECKSADLIGI